MHGVWRAYPDAARGGAGFFIPRDSSPVADAFFLAYGGLHWGYAEVMAMPVQVRRSFVEILERQLEYERKRMERKS